MTRRPSERSPAEGDPEEYGRGRQAAPAEEGAVALVPLAGGGAELSAEASALGVVAAPVDEAGPGGEQGLVDDLDAIVAGFALGGDEEAGGDEALDDGGGRGGVAEDVVELAA